MRRHPILASVALVALAAAGQAPAQSVEPANHRRPVTVVPSQPCLPVVPAPHTPPDPTVPPEQRPDAPPPDAIGPPSTDAFTQGPPAGGGETVGFNPAMFGDIIGGPTVKVLVRVPAGTTGFPQGGVTGADVPVIASVPVVARGAFKIAENESPRPTDRVFLNYNYFDRVNAGPYIPNFNLHREVIGFEKTFAEGNGSLGLRLPFLQFDGPAGDLDGSDIGDLSIIIKWAFLNDRMTGDVISAGMVVTAPTGDPFLSVGGRTIHPTVLQPFVGYIFNFGNAYVHGFSSIAIPTDSSDVTLWLNDIGLGYFLFRDDTGSRFIRGVVPTIEAHLLTPLNHRSGDGGVPDWLSLTGGVNFVFGRNSTLGVAVGAPVTGPRPFDMELIGSINFRF